jgi:heat shock protein HslJ
MMSVQNGTIITAEFTKDQIAGSAGCNHYFASYTAGISSLRIEGIGMTEMYCTALGVMDQESAYFALMGTVRQYHTSQDTLTLSGEDGRTLLIFERVVPLAPRPLVDTNWTLDSFIEGDAISSVISGTRITASFSADGSVAGIAGCNQYFAAYSRSGPSLSFSGVGSTKMFCTAPNGVMIQETRYLNAFASAKSYTIEKSQLTLLDVNGRGILSYHAED